MTAAARSLRPTRRGAVAETDKVPCRSDRQAVPGLCDRQGARSQRPTIYRVGDAPKLSARRPGKGRRMIEGRLGEERRRGFAQPSGVRPAAVYQGG